MSSTRFTQQHIIELNEKPASSLLMNKELQNIYKGTNELDDEAEIHRSKQADPTLADTAPEKHVTNAQTKKWEDTANTFSGVSPSSFVAATEVVTTATANKILKLNADGKLPTDIVGNATTASDSLLLNGKSDTAFQEVAEKDQPGGYAGLDANGKIDSEWIKDASETVKGVVELATPAEVLAGTDTERAVTPAGFKAALVSPAMTGSATLNGTTDNTVQSTDIVTALALEVGDVIRIQYSGYDKLHTVESITDDNSIIVNYEHAGNRGNGSLRLADETTTVTITRIAKWYNAPLGQGQGWVDVTASRPKNTLITNTTGRTIEALINANIHTQEALTVGGVVLPYIIDGNTKDTTFLAFAIPRGDSYMLSGWETVYMWAELR